MLFVVFGSSGAGKSAAVEALSGRVRRLAAHEFDEVGVPPDADTVWRQRITQQWVRRALDYEVRDFDTLLAGQSPFGEVLAAPSATLFEAVSGCLLDCDDDVRLDRLHRRGSEWLMRSPGTLCDYLNWAEWMRRHARDPSWHQDVIRIGDAAGTMKWERWSNWLAGDPRWRVHAVDTSRLSIDEVADVLVTWIEAERSLFRSGGHPLAHTAR